MLSVFSKLTYKVRYVVKTMYIFFLEEPLWSIYIHTPTLGWGGQHYSEICAKITNVPSTHWEFLGREECISLIGRNVKSITLVFYSGVKLYILLSFVSDLYKTLKLVLLRKFSNILSVRETT